MKFAAAVLLFSLTAVAQPIHGIVTNGTSGRPQAGVQVSLMKLENGMVEIGNAVTGPDGRFSIEAPPPSKEIPYLVSGTYQGVPYHAAARDANTDVPVEVFDKTTDRSTVKFVAEQLIAEPRTGRLLISEIYTLRNESSPPKTLVASGADKDNFHFTAAKGLVQDLTVAISGPSSLPLKQTANEHDGGVYGLDFPIRPGDSKIEVTYRLPYESSFTFDKPVTKSLVSGTPEITVIVPANVVQATSPSLTLAKQDLQQGAAFYDWKSSGPLKFDIAGLLPETNAPNQTAAPDAGLGAQSEDLATMENQNFIFQSRWKILIVLGSSLLLGLAYLYKTNPNPINSAQNAARR